MLVHYDVYLGGVMTKVWRELFKAQLSDDISVFDPMVNNFSELDNQAKFNQSAREFFIAEHCDIIVFYLDDCFSNTS